MGFREMLWILVILNMRGDGLELHAPIDESLHFAGVSGFF